LLLLYIVVGNKIPLNIWHCLAPELSYPALIPTKQYLIKALNSECIKNGSGYALHRPRETIRERLDPSRQTLYKTWSQRISEDCHGDGHWICDHGLHWVLCETHSYTDQQYHRRFLGVSWDDYDDRLSKLHHIISVSIVSMAWSRSKDWLHWWITAKYKMSHFI